MFAKSVIAAGALAGLTLGAASAQAPQVELNATETYSGDLVGFALGDRYSHYTLTISGPQGYHAQIFSEASAPLLRLADHGQVPDGRYSYTLTAATFQFDDTAPRFNNGRDVEERPRIGAERTGVFMVRNGRVEPFMAEAEEE